MRAAMYNLERAIDECRLAEYALKVEQQQADQRMAEEGNDMGGTGEDGTFARHMTVFRQYTETFMRRIAAIERVIEERSDSQTAAETT